MLPARLFFLKILFFFIFQPEKKTNNIISVSHTVGFCFAFFFFFTWRIVQSLHPFIPHL